MPARVFLALLFCLWCGIALPQPAQAISSTASVRNISVASLDKSLPDERLSAWLADTFPNGTHFHWSVKNCVIIQSTKSGKTATERPDCVQLVADVPSRARKFNLVFLAAAPNVGHRYQMLSPDSHSVTFERLSQLPALLNKPLKLKPLHCKIPGTHLHSYEHGHKLYETCILQDGTPDGPYRAWYVPGLYLMAQGTYANGRKKGDWVECVRFEACLKRHY